MAVLVDCWRNTAKRRGKLLFSVYSGVGTTGAPGAGTP